MKKIRRFRISEKHVMNLDLDVTPTNSHQSLAHRAIESFNNKVQSLSSKLPKKAWQDEPTSDDEGSFF